MKRTSSLMLGIACSLCVQVMAQSSLREATKDLFLMGVAVNNYQVNGGNRAENDLIKTHFSSIVPENCMKSSEIHPEENRWEFGPTDKMVAFGEANNQAIIGHTLIWHSQLARWFTVDEKGQAVSPEVLKARMREHIHTIMKRYKGRIKGYDVVNEAFEDNGSYRRSPFYRILGEDFIKLAFQYAHEADPDAELYYNDYNMSTPAKCDAVVRMVKSLKAEGLRIDAVGMQGHMNMDSPSVEAFEASIKKLADAGVKVMITEWDISILPNPFNHSGANISDRFAYNEANDPYRNSIPKDVQKAWNKRYTDMFGLFIKYHEVVDRVTVWGLNDGHSWKNNFPIRGRKDYPLLFDRENKVKPVVNQMIKQAEKASKKLKK
jgi:endo-1,4-beta-xylanase